MKRAALLVALGLAVAARAGHRATDLDMAGEILGLRVADVDGDKLQDLVVALETERSEERSKTFEQDGQFVVTVESVVVHERVAKVFLQKPGGTFDPRPRTIAVDPAASALDAADVDGDGRAEILFLMPDGIDAFRLDASGAPLGPAHLVSTRSVLSDATGFPSELRLAFDLDGDGLPELCVPRIGDLAIFWDDHGVYGGEPTLLPLPAVSRSRTGGGLAFAQALPTFVDANGDGRRDIVVLLDRGEVFAFVQKRPRELAKTAVHGIFPARGKGFRRSLVAARDVDGDGRLDVVAMRESGGREGARDDDDEDASSDTERLTLEVYRGAEDLSLPATPSVTVDAGEMKKGESPAWCLVRDLDGDGRAELMPVMLRVTTWQMLKAAVSRSMSVGMRMPVLRAGAEGRYASVATIEDDIDVSLKHLSMAYLLSLDGDLDGDGVKDLVAPKGAEGLVVHRGKRDGSFEKGAMEKLAAGSGEDLVGALQVQDLNGDGRDDVLVIRETWKKDRLMLRALVSQKDAP
ncbi:MAG: VCBS repeat-containing protein [Acidobacteriota bacterium]